MQFILALGTHSMSILKNHLKNINRLRSLEVASIRMGMYIFSYIFSPLNSSSIQEGCGYGYIISLELAQTGAIYQHLLWVFTYF